jgi:hypothetical protein
MMVGARRTVIILVIWTGGHDGIDTILVLGYLVTRYSERQGRLAELYARVGAVLSDHRRSRRRRSASGQQRQRPAVRHSHGPERRAPAISIDRRYSRQAAAAEESENVGVSGVGRSG